MTNITLNLIKTNVLLSMTKFTLMKNLLKRRKKKVTSSNLNAAKTSNPQNKGQRKRSEAIVR